MDDDLARRLHAINEMIDRLPMYAAMWTSLDEDDRREVRIEWGSVRHAIDHIRWNWRRYSRGDAHPEWWIMVELRIEEHERMLVYMELGNPLKAAN